MNYELCKAKGRKVKRKRPTINFFKNWKKSIEAFFVCFLTRCIFPEYLAVTGLLLYFKFIKALTVYVLNFSMEVV